MIVTKDHDPTESIEERQHILRHGEVYDTGVEIRVIPRGMAIEEARNRQLTLNMSRVSVVFFFHLFVLHCELILNFVSGLWTFNSFTKWHFTHTRSNNLMKCLLFQFFTSIFYFFDNLIHLLLI